MFSREDIAIDAVVEDEVPELRVIMLNTFIDAFGPLNKKENMDFYIANNLNLEHVSDEFNTPGSFFFFARNNKNVLGYLKVNINKAQSEENLPDALEVERIYVKHKYQGLGLGKILFEFALDFAISMESKWLWLGVWEHNTGAIRFYERMGLTPFTKHQFRLGDDIQTDIMMRIALG